MSIFVDKEIKTFFIIVAGILAGTLILCQLIILTMADEYKQNIILHDYGVAGYLYNNGADRARTASAFTAVKTEEDFTEGQKLLSEAGLIGSIKNSLLPDVDRFHKKFSGLALLFSILFSFLYISVLLFFARNRNRRIEKANAGIGSFMEGNHSVRLDISGEGSLSMLSSSINTMATSLTSHIEKEKQNREFLKNTISDISHQLKTPLTALEMYNAIIQEEETGNAVVDEFVLKSERELTRIEVLIQNLLKLSRLDAGSIKIEKRMNSLKNFLDDLIERFLTRAEQEQKTISLECDERIIMEFDETWLPEAVSNIVKNALDHTIVGNRIDICCRETPVFYQIIIKDNGSGIHPEDINHIFKRFYRSRFSKDKQGAGIGLTLAKAIVEMHGGSITVESASGKGTAFSLVFPKLSNL